MSIDELPSNLGDSNKVTIADVVIVGAGAAGIHAAYLLSKQGLKVIVLEASARLGGRVYSKPLAGGGTIELGAQWLAKSQQHRLQHVANKYGAKFVPNNYAGKHSHIVQNVVHRTKALTPPVRLHQMLDVMQMKLRISRLIRKIDTTSPWQHNAQLDTVSSLAWVKTNAWTKAGAKYWLNIIEQGICTSPSKVSALEVMQNIASACDIKTLIEADHFHFPNGLQKLLETHSRASNAEFITSSRVCSVSQIGTLMHVVDEHSKRYICDKVLVAIPPQVISKIHFSPALPAEKTRLLDSMRCGQVIKMVAVYDTPWWRQKGLSGIVMSADAPFDTVIDVSHSGKGILSALVTSTRCKHLETLSNTDLEQVFLTHIETAFNDRRKPHSLHCHRWDKEANIAGGYSSHRPIGAWLEHKNALASPIGNIFFAGTESASQWRGYVEGALASAERAVNEMSVPS